MTRSSRLIGAGTALALSLVVLREVPARAQWSLQLSSGVRVDPMLQRALTASDPNRPLQAVVVTPMSGYTQYEVGAGYLDASAAVRAVMR